MKIDSQKSPEGPLEGAERAFVGICNDLSIRNMESDCGDR
jgi:hypothetical protein